ncbi:serine/threonine-protein kinase [Paludisphaera rhizosphaerae]|uniref:serine/threonine-protein kinase n=1 Tax=Paludisphaera rhizosphaerae TaxID=2711216 RepID=UPI0013EAC73E|nr:serine/threonine-protein kinase [Paludisphaera rhizosphaerae]
MNADRSTDQDIPPAGSVERFESICDRFEDAWRNGERPTLEAFLSGAPVDPELLRELLVVELAYRKRSGEHPGVLEYLSRFPEHASTVQDAVASAVGDDDAEATHVAEDEEYEPATFVRKADASVDRVEPNRGATVEKHVAEALAQAGYEVIRELGRGGMGIVYEARQGGLGRVVALKVLRSGLFATDEECRRFLNEAEAVARLDHPAIVPIFEARRSRGLYFYSMRRVGGAGLDRKLEQGPLEPAEAARLVARVAWAVDEAHRHGVLHRDVKPANVLVDESGESFLTDFGLARRIDADGEDGTRSGAVLGTPSYMSPEQAEGRIGDLTTATDVFGLGGVLYATLTGRAPHVGSSVVDTLDRVRKVPPEPPSRINRKVPRDLESVCLKCLEKEPSRRYASARELAEDLDRWLEGRPTLARPVSALARGRMWARRHPLPAALASALGAAVILGMIGVGWQWREAERQRRHALRLLDYVSNRLLAQASTEMNPQGANVTVREVLDRQASMIGGEFQSEPETEGPLREVIGNAYHSLGLFDAAEKQLRRASELIETSEGEESLASIRVATRLGRLMGDKGAHAEAERRLSQARETSARILGPDDPATLEASARLGSVYLAEGQADKAEPLLRHVLEVRRRVLPTDHPDTLQSVNDLCRLAVATARFNVAEPLAYEYEHGIRCARGPNHPDNVTAIANRGLISRLQGKLAEAVSYQQKAAEEARRILGPDHPTTASVEREYLALRERLNQEASAKPSNP